MILGRTNHKRPKTSDGRADLTNFEMDLLDSRMSANKETEREGGECCPKNNCIRPSCFPISVIVIFVVMVIVFPVIREELYGIPKPWLRSGVCEQKCKFILVESIPENFTYINFTQTHMSTFDAWKLLLRRSKNKLDIAAFYWTLTSLDTHRGRQPSAWQGEEIFRLLNETGVSGTKIRIAQNIQKPSPNLSDSDILAINGAAEVRSLNFSHWFGSGVLHTKLWISDSKDFYIGSANMDWRSLTQVKELGALVLDCPCLAEDIQKIFDVYWKIGQPHSKLPPKWTNDLATKFNATKPLVVDLNETYAEVFISSSPAALCPKGRDPDDFAIVHVIEAAQKFVHIAVMDYDPATLYSHPNRFWPVIDNALRAAAYDKGIHVKLLCSKWNHTHHQMLAFLRSLVDFSDAINNGSIEVKLFEIPSTPEQAEIPFARVNHNKYMVTDSTALIGTSNWAGDYFLSTGGASFVIKQYDNLPENPLLPESMQPGKIIVSQLQDVFTRDWYSQYAKPLYYYIGRQKIMKPKRSKLDDTTDPASGRAWPRILTKQ